MNRKGISAGGNWIIDRIKLVDTYPEEGNLSSITRTEAPANGGAPYNVLLDIARLGLDIPLQGIGAIGDDEDGNLIIDDCMKNGIDHGLVSRKIGFHTSYTDVISSNATGQRTFFHARGANALLDIDDFKLDKIKGSICLLGYLLLLDSLDKEDEKFGTRAARLLSMLVDAGIETAVDVVSENSDRFGRIVSPSLIFTDYLVINEVEAGKILGKKLRDREKRISFDKISEAAGALLKKGVRKRVIIHFPEGAVSLSKDKASIEKYCSESFKLPEGYIKGTVGAGDAFCAGCLVGIHSKWETPEILGFANAMATACLSHPSASSGIRPFKEMQEIAGKFSLRRSDWNTASLR